MVSSDERVRDYLPEKLGTYTFINHYSGENEFWANRDYALKLLKTYRARPRLIVTTMLHAALPAIAMGIPVVVFYPLATAASRESDLGRFSSLMDLVRVHDLSDTSLVDWRGDIPDVGAIKLRLIENFFTMANRWGTVSTPRVDGILPS